jgi:pimeloyl-ACP methyl ester carboxylesterase
MRNLSRGNLKIKGFRTEEMDFQLIRQLGATSYGGSSIGECFYLASKINEAMPESWVEEFERLAKKLQQDGIERLENEHAISGREQLLKACNAYRAAEYYSPCHTKEHQMLGQESKNCFIKAINTMDLHFEEHAIEYNGEKLPYYFIAPRYDAKKQKTLIIVSGFDGTLEEEFLMRGYAGIQRGYNVVHFAGPGQLDVLRNHQETFFQPNYEEPIKLLVDKLATFDAIDSENLALMGISFGGYFAARAASYEPRIKALIANSPIIDLKAYMCAFIGLDPLRDLTDEEDFMIEHLDSFSEQELPKQLRAQTESLMRRFGGHSFKQTFSYMREFRIGENLLDIKCPTLGLIGSGEGPEPLRQFHDFCERLDADNFLFTDSQGASNHCQVGNVSFANAISYDWLDTIFKYR